MPNRGGRPTAEFDINKPWRKKTQEFLQQLVDEGRLDNVGQDKESEENNGRIEGRERYDRRPIVIDESRAIPEQSPKSETDREVADTPDTTESQKVNYQCGNCDFPLNKGEKYCSGCGSELQW